MTNDRATWKCTWKLEKFLVGEKVPYETIEGEGNILVNRGIEAIWRFLTGQESSWTAFSNSNARIGVGNVTPTVGYTDTQLDAEASGTEGVDYEWASMMSSYPLIDAANRNVIQDKI